jgi:hypothetical protein
MFQKILKTIHWLREGRIRRSIAYLITYMVFVTFFYSISGFNNFKLWYVGLILIAGFAGAIYSYWHYPVEKRESQNEVNSNLVR